MVRRVPLTCRQCKKAFSRSLILMLSDKKALVASSASAFFRSPSDDTFTTPEGQRASTTDANNLTTTWTYDGLGRMISVTDPLNHATSYGYNRLGERITMTDPKGNNSTLSYDGLGRVVTETDRLGHTTQRAYGVLGNLASLTDAEAQVTRYEYDGLGRPARTIWPDHLAGTVPGDLGYGITETAYDSIGRLLRRTDQEGETVTFVYDATGRIVQRDYRTRVNSPSGPIADSDTFTHDNAGRLLTATKGRYGNTLEFSHDAAGRISEESLTAHSQTYTIGRDYDPVGNLTQITYPDGSIVDRTTPRGTSWTRSAGTACSSHRLHTIRGCARRAGRSATA